MTSADSAQTPREIKAFPSPVPGKVDFAHLFSRKKRKTSEKPGPKLKMLAVHWVQCPGKCCFFIKSKSKPEF